MNNSRIVPIILMIIIIYALVLPISSEWQSTLSTRNSRRFEVVYGALESYKKENGHLMVPGSFKVPRHTAYPAEAWGMKLGENVRNIRRGLAYRSDHFRSSLEEIGFDFRVVMADYREFDRIFLALKIYNDIHGNFNVPRSWCVPKQEPWPEQLWGLRLGSSIALIRRGDYSSEHVATLMSIGFIPKQQRVTENNKNNNQKSLEIEELNQIQHQQHLSKNSNSLENTRKTLCTALITYKDIYGDFRVPVSFIVPHETPWPNDAWGLSLGILVKNVRHGLSFTDVESREYLSNIGFEMRGWRRDQRGFDVIMEALCTYKEIHGHINVPVNFIVPNEDPWPVSCRNLRLGTRCCSIRRGTAYFSDDCHERLTEIGFRWEHMIQPRDFKLILLALETYKSKYGTLKIPYSFTINTGDMEWPSCTWNMHLGARVNQIRKRETYKQYRAELEAIGFFDKCNVQVEDNVDVELNNNNNGESNNNTENNNNTDSNENEL
eukprot:gene8905-18430_t